MPRCPCPSKTLAVLSHSTHPPFPRSPASDHTHPLCRTAQTQQVAALPMTKPRKDRLWDDDTMRKNRPHGRSIGRAADQGGAPLTLETVARVGPPDRPGQARAFVTCCCRCTIAADFLLLCALWARNISACCAGRAVTRYMIACCHPPPGLKHLHYPKQTS